MQPTSSGKQLRARTFRSMGTVVSLTVAGSTWADAAQDELESAVEVVQGVFTELDRTFSLYRPASEASRLARGELTLACASGSMQDLYAEASEWRLATEGAFSAERPDGILDLSGIVKAHAAREAALSLGALGLHNWCLNAGGDVLVEDCPGLPGLGQGFLAARTGGQVLPHPSLFVLFQGAVQQPGKKLDCLIASHGILTPPLY